jgi:DNA-directed RNA polymerase specialized sigma24 family protein
VSWDQTLAGLVSERGAALKRHAFLLCGGDAQADDLVQEALVRAFTRPMRAVRPGGAEAYVRVIMVNLFIDGTRRQSRWKRVAPLLQPSGAPPDPADQVSGRDVIVTALRRGEDDVDRGTGTALAPGRDGCDGQPAELHQRRADAERAADQAAARAGRPRRRGVDGGGGSGDRGPVDSRP